MRLQGRARPMAAVIFLALCVIAGGYSAKVHAAPQLQDPEIPSDAQRALFVKGQTLYTQGVYSEAINTFNEFLESYPKSEIKDLTMLWLGRSYLRQGDIGNAERMNRRLREISATPYLDIYEDELRIARQNYARAATRPVTSSIVPSVAPSVAPSVPPSVDSTSEGFSRSSTTPAKPPEKRESSAAVAPAPSGTVATNRLPDQNVSSPAPLARVPPPLPKVETPTKRETRVADAVTDPVKAVAPLVRLRIEEMPSTATVNGAKFYRVVLHNEGNGVAKDLVVREELDASLDFGSSDPAPARQEISGQSLVLTYRLAGLQPGETRGLRIAVRPRPQATNRSATPTKHSVSYSDGKGKTYNTQ